MLTFDDAATVVLTVSVLIVTGLLMLEAVSMVIAAAITAITRLSMIFPSISDFVFMFKLKLCAFANHS